jgi:hypothetical protein
MSEHLQEIVDYAIKNDFKIKFTPKRKHAVFKHKRSGLKVETKLYVDDGEIWVWFSDNNGMSGNDPDYDFVHTFKQYVDNPEEETPWPWHSSFRES